MKPKIGQYIIDARLGKCVIVAVHAAGTIDVRAANGKHFRISGLAF